MCDSLDVLLPVMTKLVNTSLTKANFSTEWKQAIVTTLLKKGAKNVTHKNLRPISNFPFVSKITERAVFDQVYSHMTQKEPQAVIFLHGIWRHIKEFGIEGQIPRISSPVKLEKRC